MPATSHITERMISDFCRKRVAPHLMPVHTEALRKFLIASVDTGVGVPRYAGKYDWTAMGMLTNVPAEMLVGAGRHLTPLLDAIGRSVARAPKRAVIKKQTTVRSTPVRVDARQKRNLDVTDRADRVLSGKVQSKPDMVAPAASRPKRQYTRRPIVEFPEPLWTEWEDVDGFADALNLHIRRHGDSVRHLFYAVAKEDKATDHRTLMKWAKVECLTSWITAGQVLLLRSFSEEIFNQRFFAPNGQSGL